MAWAAGVPPPIAGRVLRSRMVVEDRGVTVPYDAAACHVGSIGQVYVAEDPIAFLERVIRQERAPGYSARARVVQSATRIDR